MYTKDELMAMPLQRLRTIDIKNKEEEALIQEIVSLKMSQIPPQTPINRIDIPDIKTKEEEEKWQKVVDERNAAMKPEVPVTIQIEQKEEELKKVKEEIDNTLVKCETCGKEMKPRGLKLHRGRFHKK